MTAAKRALVTGGSRGIGRAIALELARAGAHVLVAARGVDSCRAVVAEIEAAGGSAEAVALDVADPGIPERIAAHPIDWLINNAGIAQSAPLSRTDEALVRKHLEVNFHGAWRLAEACLPGMRKRGYGRVVNVASSAGLRGYAYVSAYCASKFALVGWTLAAADELRDSGVTVNAVCPHYVDSPMLEAAVETIVASTEQDEDQARAFLAAQNPGGALVSCEDVAAEVRTLVEGSATATLVELDGGRVRSVSPNDPNPS